MNYLRTIIYFITMPEGPEVTFLASTLTPLQGSIVTVLTVIAGRYEKQAPRGYETFVNALPLTLERVCNKGKALVFHFNNVHLKQNHAIVCHLGMYGWWTTKPKDESTIRIRMDIDGSSPLYYTDTVDYGTIECTDQESVERELSMLAPDILTDRISWEEFYQRYTRIQSKKRKWLLEDILLDQRELVSGIGNYLKSEVLYEARLSPIRYVSSLTEEECRELFDALHSVSLRILTVLQSRQTMYGSYKGLRVYKKKTDPCGNTVETRQSKHKRTTYWVPELQV